MSKTQIIRETVEPLPTPREFFQLAERADEQQIISEMQGELLDQFIYRINLRGKEIVNLSYGGVKEAIRRMGNVRVIEIIPDHSEDEYKVIVKVRDDLRNLEVTGAGTCKKTQPFAYVMAVNKAERNGFRKLLPEKMIALVIDQYAKRNPQRLLKPQEPPQ